MRRFIFGFTISLFVLGLWAHSSSGGPIALVGKPALVDALYSPDGRYLAALTRGGVELLDSRDFKTLVEFGGVSGWDDRMDFSPDGSLLAIGGDRIRIWRVPEGKLLAEIQVDSSIIGFSPDGEFLAYAKRDSVELWQVKTRKVVRRFTGDPEPMLKHIPDPQNKLGRNASAPHVLGFAFSPDGKILAVGSTRRTISLWDVQTGKLIDHLRSESDIWWKRLTFSHDGSMLAAIGETRGFNLWDMREGKLILHRYFSASSISFTPDDKKLVLGLARSDLDFLDLETFKYQSVSARQYPINVGGYERCKRLSFHPNGRTFAAVYPREGKIRIWDVEDMSLTETIYGWGKLIDPIYLPKLNLIAGYSGNNLLFYDAATGEMVSVIEFFTGPWFLEPNPDGRRFAINVDAKVQIWDAQTMQLLHEFRMPGFLSTEGIAFSSDGKLLVTSNIGGGGTQVFDTKTGEEIVKINDVAAGWSTLLFSPDSRQVVLYSEREDAINFWDIETGELVRRVRPSGYSGSSGYGTRVVFRPNGQILHARDTGKAVEIWDIRSKSPKLRWRIEKPFVEGRDRRFTPIRFTPDGRFLIVQVYRHEGGKTKNELRLYDVDKRRHVKTIPNQKHLRFSADGRYVLMWTEDDRVALYPAKDVLGYIPFSVRPEGVSLTTLGRIKRTLLLQNYPNPSNPETWIPFRLSEDSNVIIRIYDLLGRPVRRLNLGRLKAGSYVGREKAAYWDGRSDFGEEVPSGIYFYELRAGKFNDMKRLVILK
jgi:WD40 repeat protein